MLYIRHIFPFASDINAEDAFNNFFSLRLIITNLFWNEPLVAVDSQWYPVYFPTKLLPIVTIQQGQLITLNSERAPKEVLLGYNCLAGKRRLRVSVDSG